MFCVLAVTVKRSVDQLFMHYFHNFFASTPFLLGVGDLEGRSGSFCSFGRCFEGDVRLEKGCQLFGEKSAFC